MITEYNTEEYDKMDKTGSMMVEFYSKKCGPCKMLSFVLRDIDKKFQDFRIFTIDFDENQELKERLEVTGFPTMLFMRDGQEVFRLQGLQQKPAIIKAIEKVGEGAAK
jgi:thioredoxin 1